MNDDKEVLAELLRKGKQRAADDDAVDWAAVRSRWTTDPGTLYEEKQ